MLIDAASQRNLDLVESRGGTGHTLLKALDRTATPMGARKLRHWVLHPLRDLEALVSRQDFIAALLAEPPFWGVRNRRILSFVFESPVTIVLSKGGRRFSPFVSFENPFPVFTKVGDGGIDGLADTMPAFVFS